ncbi:MAG: ImmA/IrrE family metallo-endopeptidase [Candidatus Andeanibacterium colombiense]|uniref:ImmA/IrrE family metallo-endopeptidase n=1 Tax=Candidatus Andeanibacterium colombiense TaxID=3121345 RepID=A0AAJ5X3U0_9SPHN|nr:MAG: ImmA/IrrE family metallo-endopeptidase [Sphingomonadaceae bacterium]
MGSSFRAVKPMIDIEIEEAAIFTRRMLRVEPKVRVAMVNLVETVLEELLPGYVFTVLPDDEMPGMDGFTGVGHYEICLSNSTYEALNASDPDARFTVAHELGHLILHSKRSSAMAKRIEYDRRVDPEWQADCFADAWLMPYEGVLECSSVEEVVERFSVPEDAARRRFLQVKDYPKIQGELFE